MIQSVEAYITEQIESLVNTPISNINGVDSVDKLMGILLSKRYRKSKVSLEQKTTLHKYINRCTLEKKPINIYLMTGGYKQPRLPSAPHIDWAEFFNIMYMFKFGKELASHYSEMINITYRTHGSIVSALNDISEEDIKIYRDEFQDILDHFSNLLKVSNLNIATSEAYSHQETESLLNSLDGDFSDNIDSKDIEKAKRNFVNEEVSDHIASRSFSLNKRFLETDPFISNPFHSDKVCVFFRGVGPSDRLSYGSTKSSDVQYWAGVGMLNTSKNGHMYMDIKGRNSFEKGNYPKKKINLYPNYPGLREIPINKKFKNAK